MFGNIVFWLATTIISSALAPKPKSNIRPATLGDFQVPTAEEGRPISVLFGTRDCKAPQSVWYGDLKTKKVKD